MLGLACTSWAQDDPKFEVFGGYSLLHSEPRFQKNLTGHGWSSYALGGGLNARLTRRLGLRIAQVEYVGTTSGTDPTEGFRFSAGLLWRIE